MTHASYLFWVTPCEGRLLCWRVWQKYLLYHLGPKDRNNLHNSYSEIPLSIDTALLDLAVMMIFAKILCPQQDGPCRTCYNVAFFIANSFSAWKLLEVSVNANHSAVFL